MSDPANVHPSYDPEDYLGRPAYEQAALALVVGSAKMIEATLPSIEWATLILMQLPTDAIPRKALGRLYSAAAALARAAAEAQMASPEPV